LKYVKFESYTDGNYIYAKPENIRRVWDIYDKPGLCTVEILDGRQVIVKGYAADVRKKIERIESSAWWYGSRKH